MASLSASGVIQGSGNGTVGTGSSITTTEDTETEESDNTILWISLGVVGAVVLIGVALVLSRNSLI